jgi:hypothetical protein
MDVLTPRIHGIIDYVTVVFFVLAPTLFSLPSGIATVCYILAVVHLTMTIITDFPLGMVEVMPFGMHGIVELIVSIALVVLPWILADLFFGAQWFFTVVGVAIFLVWLLTDYSPVPASTKTSAKPGHQSSEHSGRQSAAGTETGRSGKNTTQNS